jgi:hypothetical protein
MTKGFLISVFLFVSFMSYGQLEEGDFLLSADYRTSLSNNVGQNHGGFNIEYMATNTLGLNYSFYLGDEYIHIPGGFLLGIVILAYVIQDAEALLYSFLIPEGITININLAEKFYLSPYLNPLGVEYHWNENVDEEVMLVGALGIKVKSFLTSKIMLIPFTEIQHNYLDAKWDLRAGISVGMKF